MKIRKGNEKLNSYQNIEVNVDWDYVTQELGFRKEEEAAEKAIGRLLSTISLIGVFFILISEWVQSRILIGEIFNVNRPIEIVFWILFFLFLYSQYLLRDRNVYDDSLKVKSLDELRKTLAKQKISAVEISRYFDHDLLILLDESINEDPQNFLVYLSKQLSLLPNVQQIISRLGLTTQQFVDVVNRFDQQQNSYVDEWLDPLVYESFVIAVENMMEKVDESAVMVYLISKPFHEQLLDDNITPKEVEAVMLWLKNNAERQRAIRLYHQKRGLKPTNTVNRAFTSRYSPTLVKFSRDFTKEIVAGDFTLSIARDNELGKLIESVSAGNQSATLVVGEPGVGKTTLIKSLGVKMVVEDVPDDLKDMRLVAFDFTKAFAISPTLEIFKQRVEQVFEETAAAKNIVLVIDDLDHFTNVRKEYAAEVVNIVTTSLDKYHLRIVATATPEGYSRHIKIHEALAAQFNVIDMNEPSDQICVQMLTDEVPKLESQYKVKISFDALVKIVNLSHKISFEKVLPDKAFDLLTEVVSKAAQEKVSFVSEQMIEQVVSEKVGVKLGAIEEKESKLLLTLEEELHKRIIGQDDAVKAVASALRRSRAGLVSEKRPIASFLFFGPTGVGKTELAKALTKVYYGDEKLMIRLDMSEYHEEENIKRLIGEETTEGFQGGYLTEEVRQKPFSLVLLDEIEKANPKVLDLFLQILDEGSIKDGLGRKINFTNTIIIATSNVASKEIADLISKGARYNDVVSQVMPRLREYLRVEFLNRFDKVVLFKLLLPIEIQQVTGLLLQDQQKRLAERGIEFTWSEQLVKELVTMGYNPVYGARELRRVIQDTVEEKIAKLIIENKVKAGIEVKFNSLNNVEVKNEK